MNTQLDRGTKRVGVMVATLAVIGGSVAATASPAAADSANGFVYTVADEGATLVRCTSKACPTELEIPATIGDSQLPVVAIADSAFGGKSLTKVSFEEGSELKTIGEWAFSYNSISELEIPASVTSIQNSAFQQSGLASLSFDNTPSNPSQLETIGASAFAINSISKLEVPASITSIEYAAFYSNGLASLSFENTPSNPSQLESIGGSAFASNSISSLWVPPKVTTIGDSAFSGSTGLNDVRFYGDKPAFGMHVFTNTGNQPFFRRAGAADWEGTASLESHQVNAVSEPVIDSQPVGGELPAGGHLDLAVGVNSDVQGQGELAYQWSRDGVEIENANSSTYQVTTAGQYQVTITSWAGEAMSTEVTVTEPTPTPTPTPTPGPGPAPAPAPASVSKHRQSAHVKLPSKLKRNKAYKLPAKTAQGVAISWKVKGAGKCKINKKKRTITCKRTTAKKKFALVGTAKATSTLYAYKVTIKRRVR